MNSNPPRPGERPPAHTQSGTPLHPEPSDSGRSSSLRTGVSDNPRPLLRLGYLPHLVRGRKPGTRVASVDRGTVYPRFASLCIGRVEAFRPPPDPWAAHSYGPEALTAETWERLLGAYARQLYKPGPRGRRPIEHQCPGFLRANRPAAGGWARTKRLEDLVLRDGDALGSMEPPPGHRQRVYPALLDELAVALTRVGWDVELHGKRLTGTAPHVVTFSDGPPITIYRQTVFAETGLSYPGLVDEELRQLPPARLFGGRRAEVSA